MQSRSNSCMCVFGVQSQCESRTKNVPFFFLCLSKGLLHDMEVAQFVLHMHVRRYIYVIIALCNGSTSAPVLRYQRCQFMVTLGQRPPLKRSLASFTCNEKLIFSAIQQFRTDLFNPFSATTDWNVSGNDTIPLQRLNTHNSYCYC